MLSLVGLAAASSLPPHRRPCPHNPPTQLNPTHLWWPLTSHHRTSHSRTSHHRTTVPHTTPHHPAPPRTALQTEAQREVALQLGLPQPSAQSSPASLRSAGASPAHDRNSATATSAVVDAVNPTFQLQYGCADGGYDYTLYIPAEAEEQALVRVLREHVARQAQAHSPPSPPRAPLLGPGRNPINLGFHRSSAMHRRYDASDAPAPAAAVGSARPDQERDDSSEPPHSPKTGSLSMITACFGVGMEGARASSGGGGSSPHQNSLARPDGGRPQGVHAKSRSQGAGAGAAFQDLLRAVGEKEQSAPMLGGFDSSGGIGPPACSSAAQVDVAAKLPPLPAAPVQSSSSSSGGSNAALPPRPHHHGHTHTLGEKTTGSVGAGGGGAFQLRSRKHRRSRSLPLTSSRSLHRALLTLDEREDEGEDSDREQPPKAAPPQPPQPPTEAQPTNANGAAPTYTPTPHVQGSSSSTSALAKARRQVAALLPPRTPPRAPAAEGGSRGGGKEKEEGGGAGVEASGSGPGRGSSQPGGRRDSL